jgi:hypothetical protein
MASAPRRRILSFFIVLEIALEPFDMAVALEGEDMGGAALHSPIHISPVADLHDYDRHFMILYSGDDPMVAYPVFPISRQGTSEGRAKLARIVEWRYAFM